MITTKELLDRIDQFLADTDMSDSKFGRCVCNDQKFLRRLREGYEYGTGDIKLGKVHTVLAFMRDYRREMAK